MKLILILATLASAYTRLIDCQYSYNFEHRESGYTGVYKDTQGAYSFFWFPYPEYTYCKQRMD